MRNLTIFPNLQIAENASSQLRVIRPIARGPDRDAHLVHRAQGRERGGARASASANMRTSSIPSGMATPDDTVSYENCQRGFASRVEPWLQGYAPGHDRLDRGRQYLLRQDRLDSRRAACWRTRSCATRRSTTVIIANGRGGWRRCWRQAGDDRGAHPPRPRSCSTARRCCSIAANGTTGSTSTCRTPCSGCRPGATRLTPTDDPDRELSLIYYRGRANLEDRVWRARSGQSVASTAPAALRPPRHQRAGRADGRERRRHRRQLHRPPLRRARRTHPRLFRPLRASSPVDTEAAGRSRARRSCCSTIPFRPWSISIRSEPAARN